MKISAAQLEIIFENKEHNIACAEKMILEAADNGADIIFFPEMTFTGFTMRVDENSDKSSETIERIKKLSAHYGIAVGFGWINKAGEKGENHYTVVSPSGEKLADYVKIHPFSYSGEDKYYEGGTELSSFTYLGKKISIFICYDLRFPEIFQAASAESEVIVVAANWPERRREHWKTLLKARAIENQSWIIGVNCCGNQQGIHYSGDSCIIMPEGKVYTEINNSEGIIFSSIGDEAIEARKSFPVKKDRRNNLYKIFYL